MISIPNIPNYNEFFLYFLNMFENIVEAIAEIVNIFLPEQTFIFPNPLTN